MDGISALIDRVRGPVQSVTGRSLLAGIWQFCDRDPMFLKIKREPQPHDPLQGLTSPVFWQTSSITPQIDRPGPFIF